jgi:hypothetical protein
MRRSVAMAASSQRLASSAAALRVEVPGKKQVQVACRLGRRGQILGIGQPGGRVLGREAGDVVGRTHRLLQRRW